MPEPIFEPGPVDTPFVYTVSGTGEVVPRACQAVYDGSGAGGDYIPAVIFRSQAGHVVSRAILQSTVAAGDDAEVSWFPGVKAGAQAAVTVGSYLRVIAGPSQPAGSIVLQNGTNMPIVNFDTNDAARFVQVDSTHWTMTDGAYMMTGALRTTGAVVTANADLTVGVNSGGGFVAYAFGGNATRILTLGYGSLSVPGQGSATHWHMVASGADTHNIWVGEVDINYVLGT